MDSSKNRSDISSSVKESVLFPEVAVVNGVVISVSTGVVVPDVCMKDLYISAGVYSGLVRWATNNGSLVSGKVMLSSVLLISEEDKCRFPRGSWAKIYNVVSEYLTSHLDHSEMVDVMDTADSLALAHVIPEKPKNDDCCLSENLFASENSTLAEGYEIFGENILETASGRVIFDVPVEQLDLSNPAVNALKINGVVSVSQLIGMPYKTFHAFRNLGAKKAVEILEKLDIFLKKTESVCAPSVETEALQKCRELLAEAHRKEDQKNLINAYFVIHPFAKRSIHDFAEILEIEDVELLNEVLSEMALGGECVRDGDVVYKTYPSFFQKMQDICTKNSDARRLEVVRIRREGKTLDEIGQAWGLTRERVRQMESQVFRVVSNIYDGYFEEDRFAELYQKYYLEKSLVLALPEMSVSTAYYLNQRYTHGALMIEDALTDDSFPVEVRKAIEAWLYRDYLHLDGELIPVDRHSIEQYVLRTFFRNTKGTFDEFVVKYNEFVAQQGFSQETVDDLIIGEDQKRTRENKIVASRHVLWSQNRHLRYYDIDAGDYDLLMEVLNFPQYKNIDISTMKFIRNYPVLMKQYDIRDEYELHNLLKKLFEGKDCGIQFSKMPTIRFGEFDRDEYVRETLFGLAPISAEDLAKYISEELGFGEMFLMNWFSCISEYYHRGMYTVDSIPMSITNMWKLSAVMTEDLYFFDELKDIYRNLIPNANVAEISPYNLKKMGYQVNGKYAFRHYPSADAYFRRLFSSDFVDAIPFHNRYKGLSTYLQVLLDLERNWEVLEVDEMQYINFRRVEELGVEKADFEEYCRSVRNFIGDDVYFTVESLRKLGFVSPLDDLSFAPLFYASILRGCPEISYGKLGGNIVFHFGAVSVSVAELIAASVQKLGSVTPDEVVRFLKEDYNVLLDRSRIIEKSKSAGVYYDRIMGKLYANYDFYCEKENQN